MLSARKVGGFGLPYLCPVRTWGDYAELLGATWIEFDSKIPICVIFLIKSVALELMVYRASYALHNPFESGLEAKI